jgi:hypothetical protein
MCRTPFEWGEHVPIAKAVGLTRQEAEPIPEGYGLLHHGALFRQFVAPATETGNQAWNALTPVG